MGRVSGVPKFHPHVLLFYEMAKEKKLIDENASLDDFSMEAVEYAAKNRMPFKRDLDLVATSVGFMMWKKHGVSLMVTKNEERY